MNSIVPPLSGTELVRLHGKQSIKHGRQNEGIIIRFQYWG